MLLSIEEEMSHFVRHDRTPSPRGDFARGLLFSLLELYPKRILSLSRGKFERGTFTPFDLTEEISRYARNDSAAVTPKCHSEGSPSLTIQEPLVTIFRICKLEVFLYKHLLFLVFCYTIFYNE